MTQGITKHHLIRREAIPGSGKALDGKALVPATSLPEGHSPSKMRASRRRGKVEGRGLVHREPKEGMMVEEKPFGERGQ